MRRRVAVYGATDEALALLPALARRSDLELVLVYDPEARALRRRLALIEPGAARLLQQTLADDPAALAALPDLAAVITSAPAAALPAAARAAAAELLSPEQAAERLGLASGPWREPSAPARGPADALAQALEAAIAAGLPCALLRCDAEPRADVADPAARGRALRVATEALRATLAPDEPLVRDADGALLALLRCRPDAEHVAELARQVAERVAREPAAGAGLGFGYALHPEDGRSAAALRARAARTRIRML